MRNGARRRGRKRRIEPESFSPDSTLMMARAGAPETSSVGVMARPASRSTPSKGQDSAEKVDCNDVRLPVDDGRDVSFIPRDDAGERL